MAQNLKKQDLRSVKTKNALVRAMRILLGSRSFGKITVFDLCEESMISRAAFYSHFKDKYDLIKYCFVQMKRDLVRVFKQNNGDSIFEQLYELLLQNRLEFSNLVKDIDWEIHAILIDFLSPEFIEGDRADPQKHNTMASLLSGGVLNLLLSQADNDFIFDKNALTHAFEIIELVEQWRKYEKEEQEHGKATTRTARQN